MLLDCTSAMSTLKSLAALAGAPPVKVLAAVRSVTRDELAGSGDPELALPGLAAERLGLEVMTGFSEVRYFHGSRTLDPDGYSRRGLLPLPDVLENIWDGLRRAGLDFMSASEFVELREFIEGGGGGHSGSLYRLKTTDAMGYGPFGEYVREHFVRPREVNNHEYLRTPELVEDISTVARKCLGVDLLAAFSAAAAPCIVAFDMPVEDDSRAVRAACWYVHAAANGALTSNASGGFDGHGVGVPPSAIRKVEILDPWSARRC
jgi:hypothetical protein